MLNTIKSSRSLFFYFKPFDWDYHKSQQRLHWPAEKMQAFALEKIRAIVDYAYAHTEFYRQALKEVGYSQHSIGKLSDLGFLPILTKKKLREAVGNKTIFPKGMAFSNLMEASTTGSTGEPLTLFFDRKCTQMRNMNIARAYAMMGVKPWERTLQIWRKKEMNIVQKTKSFLKLYKNISVVDIFDVKGSAINNENLRGIVETIKKFHPDTIEGYVSALYVLAKYLKANHLIIKPKRIICCAEYLPHVVWDELKEIFQCPIYNLYGGTEASLVSLSQDDVSKKMFFMDDFYWSEIVDTRGKVCHEGETGRILITDYYSRAVPLIRYEIGDMAEPSSQYHGPFRTAKEIYGRINDVFVLPNRTLFFSHNWHIYFRDLPGLERFKVIQKKIDEIEINLLPYDKKLLMNQVNALQETLHHSLGKEMTLHITIVDSLPLSPGEKFRAVESKIDWRNYL